MHELRQQWSAVPDLRDVVIEKRDLRIGSRTGLEQWSVSGNLDAALRLCDVASPPVGALGIVPGSPYAVRVARDRILLVGDLPLPIEPGWAGDGFMASPMSAALHVFELEGGGIAEVVRRACVIDPRSPGPSAAVSFAGVTALMYRAGPAGSLRLHVDRGLAPYVWTWLGTTCRLLDEGSPAAA